MRIKLYHWIIGKFSSRISVFFQSAQGNVNNSKIKVADKEVELNNVDHESEHVSDETISNSELSDEEIFFFFLQSVLICLFLGGNL